MDEKFRKQMEENGADVNTTLKRFMGNEALYMKFIVKFLDDKNFDGIADSLAQGNYEGAFNSAHTLKGVAANLGLDPVSAGASRITELLRNKAPEDVDVEKVNESKDELEKAYNLFKTIIGENR
ncbi:MAG: Hpt domain-containing protein [Lachnospiraceae bacterium]|nr:Hpt domain-containing protein [Lachnospiraceae bacterium]MDE7333457.1 Hpt domain-containing protein [Lachnospiraceae bacterium]